MGDRSLEKFRAEYEKLHRALKKSHDSEKRLMNKCRELNAEIVANSAKVATALKLSQDDQSTIAQLKKVKYDGVAVMFKNDYMNTIIDLVVSIQTTQYYYKILNLCSFV